MKKRSKKILLVILIVLGLGVSLYFYMRFEYQNIKITEVSLPNLPEELQGIKIVYAADFQYDQSWNSGDIEEKVFQKSIAMILEQEADIIILGGDYATYRTQGGAMLPYLSQLHAPLGVYAILGNHDYVNREVLLDGLSENINFLENEEAVVSFGGGKLHLFGVDDYWKGEPSVRGVSSKEADGYSLLLTHNPDYFESLSGSERELFDFSLAGHIHGGQMTFFGFFGIPQVLRTVTRYGEAYRYGYKIVDGHHIYVTSGLGGNVFRQPLRFGAQPEIVVLK